MSRDPSCLFCRIAAGEIPAEVLYQDADVTAFRDVNPQAPFHALLIPRRHVPTLDALGQEDRELVGRLVLEAIRLAREQGLSEGGYRLVWNCGPDAGQSVFHVHLHVLGGRSLGWPPG